MNFILDFLIYFNSLVPVKTCQSESIGFCTEETNGDLFKAYIGVIKTRRFQ